MLDINILTASNIYRAGVACFGLILAFTSIIGLVIVSLI